MSHDDFLGFGTKLYGKLPAVHRVLPHNWSAAMQHCRHADFTSVQYQHIAFGGEIFTYWPAGWWEPKKLEIPHSQLEMASLPPFSHINLPVKVWKLVISGGHLLWHSKEDSIIGFHCILLILQYHNQIHMYDFYPWYPIHRRKSSLDVNQELYCKDATMPQSITQ